MLEFTHVGDLTSEEVDRLRAVYQPLAESVRDLVDATIRTEVEAEEVAAIRAQIEACDRTVADTTDRRRVRGALHHRRRPDGVG